MDTAAKTIVILGAGFGGLRAAAQITKRLRAEKLIKKYQVILIDRNDYQIYTPLLYKVATTPKKAADNARLGEIATYPIRPVIENLPVTFRQDEVESMDLMRGDIHLKNGGEILADYLVIALGSEVNYFGIPGMKEFSLPLKTFTDAMEIRDALWNIAHERNNVKIIIGGAGPTGVELAGEIRMLCGELRKELGSCDLDVTIVEGTPAILPGFSKDVVRRAEKRLLQLGIKITTNGKISAVTKNEAAIADGKKVAYDIMIWSGGIKSPVILTNMPLSAEANGKPTATDEMQCPPKTPELKLYTKVYGLGDSVCFHDPITKRPVPAVARAAIIQADVVAHNIVEEIKMSEITGYKSHVISYAPREYPFVIPIGGKWAIAKIGPLRFYGFIGWIFKGLVELNYLLSIMSFSRALKVWLKGLKIFIQNDRLG